MTSEPLLPYLGCQHANMCHSVVSMKSQPPLRLATFCAEASHALQGVVVDKQLDAMGLKVKRGTIQDAAFIEADPGKSKKAFDGVAKTRHSRDGTWTKKGKKSYFGYKLHQKSDIDYGLIREIETTTAKVHDSRVDLSIEDEVVIRDRGYFGVSARGDDFTMVRRTTDAPLGELDKERNNLISKLRSPGERPHAVIKRVFNAGRVLVTTVRRVHVKMIVTAFALLSLSAMTSYCFRFFLSVFTFLTSTRKSF